jgi:rhomboid family GlyGly-CTERM serine protease
MHGEKSTAGWMYPVRLELVVALLLLVVNAPLFNGGSASAFAFIPSRVAGGEWWRVLTHPFAHVSWYHLLLDGAAFFLLCRELRVWSVARRIAAFSFSAAGSLIAALTHPEISQLGFCGLSGVAHGLMVITALEMTRRTARWERRLGGAALLLVLAKCVTEALSGQVALSFLHFGLMGVPIGGSHAGGALGALLWCSLSSSKLKIARMLNEGENRS